MTGYVVRLDVIFDHEDGHLLDPEERVVQTIEDSQLDALAILVHDVDRYEGTPFWRR